MAISFDEYWYQISQKDPMAWRIGELIDPEWRNIMYFGAAAGWTPDVLQGWLQNTNYYRNTTEAHRQWDVLSATDPAEAVKRFSKAQAAVDRAAGVYGYSWAPGEYDSFLRNVVQENMTEEEVGRQLAADIQFRRAMGDEGIYSYIQSTPAGLGALQTKFMGLGRQYGIDVDAQFAANWALGVLIGDKTEESATQEVRQWAKAIYAGNQPIIDAIDQGFTVDEFARPYAQMASQSLEINPADINWSDPKWQKAINTLDADGTRGPMDLNDWQRTIRTDPLYGFDSTTNARTTSAQLSTTLMQQFGALG